MNFIVQKRPIAITVSSLVIRLSYKASNTNSGGGGGVISKQDRHTHNTRTVAPEHGCPVHPSGLKRHRKQYRTFLPS